MQRPFITQVDPNTQNYPLPEGYPQDGVLKPGTIWINKILIQEKPMLELPCNLKLRNNAKTLRQARNLPEILFWMQVTKGNFIKLILTGSRLSEITLPIFTLSSLD